MSIPPDELSGDGVVVPEFTLMVFDNNEDNIDITVNIPRTPDIKKHASLGLMYGLAWLLLEREGLVEKRVDFLLENGPMNEVDAVNSINLLLSMGRDEIPS
jgi:hypothetical protein